MYITESQNIRESVLFLLSARDTLTQMVLESNHENSDEMVGFLENEASDYEIMSLLVTGVLPEEKQNIAAEAYLFSFMKEQTLKSHDLVVKAMGTDAFNSFLHEVDSVFPAMMTTKPMLKFYQEQGNAIAIIEQSPTMAGLKGVVKTAKDYYSPGGGGEAVGGAVKTAKDYWMKAGGDAVSAGRAAIEKGLPQFKSWATSPAGQGVAGAALGALVIYGAMKAYRRFFSAAAKACAGQSGEAKTACMGKAKKSAYAKKAAFLQAGMGACAKSKNPEKCKAAIGRKVSSLQAKAA
jgi:hypothetical protein